MQINFRLEKNSKTSKIANAHWVHFKIVFLTYLSSVRLRLKHFILPYLRHIPMDLIILFENIDEGPLQFLGNKK